MAVDYTELKRRLEEQQRCLKAELESLRRAPAGQVAELPPGCGNHMADDATDTFDHERDLSLERHLEAILAKVEEALHKFALGTYGRCEDCGREIAAERLAALPYASLCIRCKTRQEARRHPSFL